MKLSNAKDDKERPETFNICDLTKYFLKQLPKNTEIKKTYFFLIKLLTFLNYWSSQREKLIATAKIFLLT